MEDEELGFREGKHSIQFTAEIRLEFNTGLNPQDSSLQNHPTIYQNVMPARAFCT